jgi:hypothetical protein
MCEVAYTRVTREEVSKQMTRHRISQVIADAIFFLTCMGHVLVIWKIVVLREIKKSMWQCKLFP